MANGPEPQDRFNEELKKFREKLDGPKKPPTITLPGFLFRGNDRDREYTGSLTKDEADLVRQHTETYRRGLETRDQLLDRIKPTEILEEVRAIWGKGETSSIEGKYSETQRGSRLVYSYDVIGEEEVSDTYIGTEWVSEGFGAFRTGYQREVTRTNYKKTGKWHVSGYNGSNAEIIVDFGNKQYPSSGSLPGDPGRPFMRTSCIRPIDPTLDEEGKRKREEKIREEEEEFLGYFADYYRHQGGSYPIHYEFPKVYLPQRIWRRPDNLAITGSITPFFSFVGRGFVFDQFVSQQEIIDRFSQELEAQRRAGELPSQKEALELAKIDELRKRGLFVEPHK